MGQESSSSKHNDDQVLAKYYSQLKPRKEPFAEKYELINTVLGEGITGKVYKCRLKRTPNSEVFALKVCNSSYFVKLVAVVVERVFGF